jgi:hypothetical protein
MRIRIVKEPPIAGIDGIRLDCFAVGKEYEVGNTIGALFLAEGWAEPVALDAPRPYTPFTAEDPFDSRVLYRDHPPNLVKERHSPFLDRDVEPDVVWRASLRRRVRR